MNPGKFWQDKLRPVEQTSFFRCDGSSRYFDINYGVWRTGSENFVSQIAVGRAFVEPNTHRLRVDPFPDSPVGNPPMHLGMTITSIHFAYMLGEIERWIPGGEKLEAVEIGGGFGGFARAFLSEWPKARITLVDFLPMLELQSWYLSRHPLLKVERQFYVVAGTPLPDRYDVALNMTSMCEMDLDQVHFYRAQLERSLLPGGLFLSVNHVSCQNERSDWGFDGPRWQMIYDLPFPHLAKKRGNLTVYRRAPV